LEQQVFQLMNPVVVGQKPGKGGVLGVGSHRKISFMIPVVVGQKPGKGGVLGVGSHRKISFMIPVAPLGLLGSWVDF
jgi:hypothetical protein